MSAASMFRKGNFTPEDRSVLFFLWFGYVFLYMTRINISVAIPALTAALWLALLVLACALALLLRVLAATA
ncbi:MAG: hypothetical protein GX916_02910 [Clostridiales bacterium]|jgi:sugar phosphate permease|nr:hypothetical protein [Clostridiales bacterium]